MSQNEIPTLKSLTNAHRVSGRPTLKSRQHVFRNRSFHNLKEISKQTNEKLANQSNEKLAKQSNELLEGNLKKYKVMNISYGQNDDNTIQVSAGHGAYMNKTK